MVGASSRFWVGIVRTHGPSVGAGQLVVYATRGKGQPVGIAMYQFINHLLRTIIEAFIEPLSIDHAISASDCFQLVG